MLVAGLGARLSVDRHLGGNRVPANPDFFESPYNVAASRALAQACLKALREGGTSTDFPSVREFFSDVPGGERVAGSVSVHHTIDDGQDNVEMVPVFDDGHGGRVKCYWDYEIIKGKTHRVWVCNPL
ncbi:hypothetical protein Acsp06_52960 [Actinomycetospora sp. NBRC 106375]|nr:hypothetical protein Acsp06_52960 [Actinomycetospora sp. NBRC 106375]